MKNQTLIQFAEYVATLTATTAIYLAQATLKKQIMNLYQ